MNKTRKFLFLFSFSSFADRASYLNILDQWMKRIWNKSLQFFFNQLKQHSSKSILFKCNCHVIQSISKSKYLNNSYTLQISHKRNDLYNVIL